MLKGLARMFVSGLVIPFFVVRRSSFVSVRGKVVEFNSSLMGISHVAPRSGHRPQTVRRETILPLECPREMLVSTIHQALKR